MFKWIYNAAIYRKDNGSVLKDVKFDTYEEAEKFIEDNIRDFDDNEYPPTGHITKDFVKVI